MFLSMVVSLSFSLAVALVAVMVIPWERSPNPERRWSKSP